MPIFIGSSKNKKVPEKHLLYFIEYEYAKAFDYVDHNKLWEKILKEIGIPDHLICLLRNLYAAQEATVRTRHGITDWLLVLSLHGKLMGKQWKQ